ncbi:MAG: tRNA (cytidine(34)-2'-O)-methyltransferase [Rhodospirillales bacterium]|nr:MAG: tRNA (cytidine(34)-2'-O)-methyltransferase [Rhodospirillales bacterium]
MRLALFQPDIPQNTGTLIRTAACLGIAVDIIEPCGFLFTDRHFRRAGLDYLDRASLHRHDSWPAFQAARIAGPGSRLILLTTAGPDAYTRFRFHGDDILMVGRESAGVPADVHAAADARLSIPMMAAARSLNVAVAAAMVLGEALRQTAWADGAVAGVVPSGGQVGDSHHV